MSIQVSQEGNGAVRQPLPIAPDIRALTLQEPEGDRQYDGNHDTQHGQDDVVVTVQSAIIKVRNMNGYMTEAEEVDVGAITIHYMYLIPYLIPYSIPYNGLPDSLTTSIKWMTFAPCRDQRSTIRT